MNGLKSPYLSINFIYSLWLALPHSRWSKCVPSSLGRGPGSIPPFRKNEHTVDAVSTSLNRWVSGNVSEAPVLDAGVHINIQGLVNIGCVEPSRNRREPCELSAQYPPWCRPCRGQPPSPVFSGRSPCRCS